MGQRMALGDQALVLTAAAAGTYTSGPVANSGAASDVIVMVHVTAATGTGPTLVCSLEESATGEGGWTAVPGSATASLGAAGNAMSNARATKSYVRVTATVGGTGPAVTGRVSALVFPE